VSNYRMNATECAAYLNVPVKALVKWCRRGWLPDAHKPEGRSSHWVIRRPDADKFAGSPRGQGLIAQARRARDSQREVGRIPEPSIIGEEWLSTTEAAALIGRTRSRLGQLCRKGKLRAKQDSNGHWRIDPQSIHQRGGISAESRRDRKINIKVHPIFVPDCNCLGCRMCRRGLKPCRFTRWLHGGSLSLTPA
jgi:hypothetical protein